MDGLSLRRATAADAAAITGLTRAAYAPWVELIGREPLPMSVDYAEALVRNRFDLLEHDGGLAALIETAAASDHLLIVNLAVDPAIHGQGLGRRLLAHAEHLAREAGVDVLRLYTNQRFARNIAIYRQAGYAVDREETLANGVVVHMEKRLTA